MASELDSFPSGLNVRLTLSPQVNIHVPAPELQSDTIAITGLAANVDRAKAGLLDRVKELQAEQEDRVSKNGPACPGLETVYVQSIFPAPGQEAKPGGIPVLYTSPKRPRIFYSS